MYENSATEDDEVIVHTNPKEALLNVKFNVPEGYFKDEARKHGYNLGALVDDEEWGYVYQDTGTINYVR